MGLSIGLIGGRGYVGESLLQLLLQHPTLELAWISSRSLTGKAVQAVYPAIPLDLEFESIGPTDLGKKESDIVVLAMPNGIAGNYVDALKHGQKVIDISADYRFDESWIYGLPEHNREKIRDADRVSNPGCYATTVQLALAPLLEYLDSVPSAFGVSGYSGAGRTPSPRNDPERLSGNFLPYSLSGHLHELEISHQLGQAVRFMPHVAEFFRGISVTISATLNQSVSEKGLYGIFAAFYADESLIDVTADIPEVRIVSGTPRAVIGGFTVDQRDDRRISVVACLDNLLKGAASQALQNMNLMLGLDEFSGLDFNP
jgi:N-acetyl-gamma-glutamyl-phosphate reductase common form